MVMQMMLAVFDFPEMSTGDDAAAVPSLIVDCLRGYQRQVELNGLRGSILRLPPQRARQARTPPDHPRGRRRRAIARS